MFSCSTSLPFKGDGSGHSLQRNPSSILPTAVPLTLFSLLDPDEGQECRYINHPPLGYAVIVTFEAEQGDLLKTQLFPRSS